MTNSEKRNSYSAPEMIVVGKVEELTGYADWGPHWEGLYKYSNSSSDAIDIEIELNG